jgi:hypothetical protein
MGVPYPGAKAYLPFTCNAARVSETATNFLHQVDLSVALSNAYFKSLLTTRANLLICNAAGSIMPSKMLLDLTANTLLVYFDGPKSTSANTQYYLCASPLFTQVDSMAAFTNCGIESYWGMDDASSPMSNYAGGPTLIGGGSWSSVAGMFNRAVSSTVSTDFLTSDISVFANKTSFTYTVLFKPGAVAGDNIFFSYRTSAGVIGFQIYYNPTIMNVYIGGAGNFGQIANPLINNTPCLISVVYDGSQGTNATKLKLFVNNEQKTFGGFNGTIASSIPSITGADIGNGLSGVATASPVGAIDDQCVSGTASTLGCVSDRYAMLFNPSTFYTLSDVVKVTSLLGIPYQHTGLIL